MAKRKDYTDPLTTGRLIEAVMEFRGMTINDFAKAVGYHPMNLYKLLRGARNITPELAIKFAKVLNMSPLVIMTSRNLEIIDKEK